MVTKDRDMYGYGDTSYSCEDHHQEAENDLGPEHPVEFTEAVRMYHALIGKVALSGTDHFHDADDVRQEALIKAWEKWDDIRGRGDPVGWLVTVTHRKAIDKRRSNAYQDSHRVLTAEPPSYPSREDLLQSDIEAFAHSSGLDLELIALLEGAAQSSRKPDEVMSLILSLIDDNVSYPDYIEKQRANGNDLSLGTVKSWMHYVRGRLLPHKDAVVDFLQGGKDTLVKEQLEIIDSKKVHLQEYNHIEVLLGDKRFYVELDSAHHILAARFLSVLNTAPFRDMKDSRVISTSQLCEYIWSRMPLSERRLFTRTEAEEYGDSSPIVSDTMTVQSRLLLPTQDQPQLIKLADPGHILLPQTIDIRTSLPRFKKKSPPKSWHALYC